MFGAYYFHLLIFKHISPLNGTNDLQGVHLDFHNDFPSGRTVTLGSTQPLKEMSIRNILGDKGGRCVGLTTLPPSYADCLEIWEP